MNEVDILTLRHLPSVHSQSLHIRRRIANLGRRILPDGQERRQRKAYPTHETTSQHIPHHSRQPRKKEGYSRLSNRQRLRNTPHNQRWSIQRLLKVFPLIPEHQCCSPTVHEQQEDVSGSEKEEDHL